MCTAENQLRELGVRTRRNLVSQSKGPGLCAVRLEADPRSTKTNQVKYDIVSFFEHAIFPYIKPDRRQGSLLAETFKDSGNAERLGPGPPGCGEAGCEALVW